MFDEIAKLCYNIMAFLQVFLNCDKRFQVDKRYPNVIRVAPVHLYNNYVDIRRFISVLQEVAHIVESE